MEKGKSVNEGKVLSENIPKFPDTSEIESVVFELWRVETKRYVEEELAKIEKMVKKKHHTEVVANKLCFLIIEFLEALGGDEKP